MTITILPLTGIEINEKKIKLGMSKEDIVSALGEAETIYENLPDAQDKVHLYYFESELRFDLNNENKLEFIELLGGAEGKLRPEIYGVPAFLAKADELLRLLTEKNNGDITDDEDGYSYAFPNIGIGIYRESVPEDIEEMLRDAEEQGEPLSEEEYNHELSLAEHWATIGIGGKDCYSAF